MGSCFACIGLLDGIVPPVDLLRREGGLVALGIDSAGSNNCITLFNEMKLATLFSDFKSRSLDVIPASEALRMGTIEGAGAIGLSKGIGSLAHGKQDDLILVDLSELNLSHGAGTDPKHPPQPRVCGNRARSRHRDGRWPALMCAHQILAINEEDVRREAQEAAEEISRRVLADP